LPAIATDILHVGPFGYGILRVAPVGRWRWRSSVVGCARKKPGRVLLIVEAVGLATMGHRARLAADHRCARRVRRLDNIRS
jgi:hypothetical protein